MKWCSRLRYLRHHAGVSRPGVGRFHHRGELGPLDEDAGDAARQVGWRFDVSVEEEDDLAPGGARTDVSRPRRTALLVELDHPGANRRCHLRGGLIDSVDHDDDFARWRLESSQAPGRARPVPRRAADRDDHRDVRRAELEGSAAGRVDCRSRQGAVSAWTGGRCPITDISALQVPRRERCGVGERPSPASPALSCCRLHRSPWPTY